MSTTSRTYGGHPDQMYELFESEAFGKPTLVLMHGGYWRAQHDREHMRPLAQALCDAGWEVILVEYRRSPHSPEETISDIEAFLSGLAPDPIVVIGFSVGGQLALLTAGHHENIRSVIALAPVTDLVRSELEDLGEGAVRDWLNQPASQYPQFDPARSTPPALPITIFHGTSDTRVPIDHSRQYFAHALRSEREIDLIELEGAGHFDLIDPMHPYFQELLKVLSSFN